MIEQWEPFHRSNDQEKCFQSLSTLNKSALELHLAETLSLMIYDFLDGCPKEIEKLRTKFQSK